MAKLGGLAEHETAEYMLNIMFYMTAPSYLTWCLKSSVNGTIKQTKQKIQTN
jgi:hypothetical protein